MALRRTKISWADYSGADLNFIIGCTPASEGCANCYAARWAKRVGRDFGQVDVSWKKLNRLGRWAFVGPEPYRRGPGSKPIMFPVDLGDLFHPDVPENMILAALDIFATREDADWVLLTKRPERMLEVTNHWLESFELEVLPPNIWCMVTAENQRRADERIPILLQVRAQVRGVSLEPMLGPIYLRKDPGRCWTQPSRWGMLQGLHWVICGAESGPKRRPFEVAWAEGVYGQCRAAGVPFFFKQQSGLRPGTNPILMGCEIKEFPHGQRTMPCDDCELESGCIVQPLTEECRMYRGK